MKFQRGFTLLEIMIALFILTIVGILISTGLHMIVNTQNKIETKTKALSELQLAIILMERDMQQMINQPTLDEIGVTFMRTGFINPFTVSQGDMTQKIAYKIKDTTLIRFIWNTADKEPEMQQILTHVKSFHIKLIPEKNPQAIVIEMTVMELGDVKRIIPLVGSVSGGNVNATIAF